MEVFILTNPFPISLSLNNKLCIVVGGGNIAFRRVSKLLESGALVRVISPDISPEFSNLIPKKTNFSWCKAHYIGPEDLYHSSLVFAATDDSSLNERIYNDAKCLGIFTNIASDGKLSDFIIPSSFNQGDLQISVSTSGKVPGLSKAIKEHLEEALGPEYKTLITILEEIRTLALADSKNKTKNRYILSDITANYLTILEALNTGINPDILRKELLNRLK